MGIAPQPAPAQPANQPAPAPQNGDPAKPPGGFFQEDNGNSSSMRLMSFIALIAAIGFSLILLTPLLRGKGAWPEGLPTDFLFNGMVIVFGFLLAAFAPKALQKFAEKKVTPRKGG